MMYLPIKTQQSCAIAWLKATEKVIEQPGKEARNVIIDIDFPLSCDQNDFQIVNTVNDFLKNSEKPMPIQSTANTIFPISLYSNYGAPKFYQVYNEIYERIMNQPGQWGRYFHRMTCRKKANGTEINPLEEIIERLRKITNGEVNFYKNVCELDVTDSTLGITIYDHEKDAKRLRNRQCLSYLCFKPERHRGIARLNLTAIYRNHSYVGRLLGNLIGLARLMKFVGSESSLKVGCLTILSTYANVDVPEGYRIGEVRDLLDRCSKIASN